MIWSYPTQQHHIQVAEYSVSTTNWVPGESGCHGVTVDSAAVMIGDFGRTWEVLAPVDFAELVCQRCEDRVSEREEGKNREMRQREREKSYFTWPSWRKDQTQAFSKRFVLGSCLCVAC